MFISEFRQMTHEIDYLCWWRIDLCKISRVRIPISTDFVIHLWNTRRVVEVTCLCSECYRNTTLTKIANENAKFPTFWPPPPLPFTTLGLFWGTLTLLSKVRQNRSPWGMFSLRVTPVHPSCPLYCHASLKDPSIAPNVNSIVIQGFGNQIAGSH